MDAQGFCKSVVVSGSSKNNGPPDRGIIVIKINPTSNGQSLERPGQSVGKKSIHGGNPIDG